MTVWRYFDFMGRKVQHDPCTLDKEACCDFLLASADPVIHHRARTDPRPPGEYHHEGVVVSTAGANLGKTCRALHLSGRRSR